MTEKSIKLKRQGVFLLLQEIYEKASPLCIFPEVPDYKEKWRTERIHYVMGFISAINPDIISKIKSTEDHEGFLTVAWKSFPDKWEIDIVDFAWEVHDGTDGNTEHIINIKL